MVMALFVPHMARRESLRVCTLHAVALPIPSVDFSGEAPLLSELHLYTSIASSAALPTCEDATRPLHTLRLSALTMDARMFHATCLYTPRTLPALDTLTLVGPGLTAYKAPAMSAAELLSCVGRIRSLRTLRLDGVYFDEEESETDLEDAVDYTRILSHHLRFLSCRRLCGDALALSLAQLGRSTEGDDNYCHLQIIDCELPYGPPLQAFTEIRLVDIQTDYLDWESFSGFVRQAARCSTLKIINCAWFTGAELDEDTVGVWPLPRLRNLIVVECPRVCNRTSQDIVRARRAKSKAGVHVNELVNITLEPFATELRDNDYDVYGAV